MSAIEIIDHHEVDEEPQDYVQEGHVEEPAELEYQRIGAELSAEDFKILVASFVGKTAVVSASVAFFRSPLGHTVKYTGVRNAKKPETFLRFEQYPTEILSQNGNDVHFRHSDTPMGVDVEAIVALEHLEFWQIKEREAEDTPTQQ